MYRAKAQGSTSDKDGNQYRFDSGTPVDAPKGTLDHCEDLEWIKEKAKQDDVKTDFKQEEPKKKTVKRRRKK